MANHCSAAYRIDTSTLTYIKNKKGGTIMTMITNITGRESTGELLELRRIDKRNRMQKRVEQMFGDVMNIRSESESTDDNISHAYLFPLAA